jgi:hypothetical protein
MENFIKNPLWWIVILLIITNLLLWGISQNIGHPYKNGKATGLYKAIGEVESLSSEIIDTLKGSSQSLIK